MPHNDIIESADAPNRIVRVTLLRAYPGWRVREYANGIFDATNDIGLSPGFKSFAETVAHVREEVAPRDLDGNQLEREEGVYRIAGVVQCSFSFEDSFGTVCRCSLEQGHIGSHLDLVEAGKR